MRYTTTVEFEDGDDYICEDVEFDLDYHYDPGQPDNFRGHPDNWEPGYPAEFEIEGARVYAFGRWYLLSPEEVLPFLDLDALEAEVQGDSYNEPDPDDYYDSRFDRDY